MTASTLFDQFAQNPHPTPNPIQYFRLSYLNKTWIGSHIFNFQVRDSASVVCCSLFRFSHFNKNLTKQFDFCLFQTDNGIFFHGCRNAVFIWRAILDACVGHSKQQRQSSHQMLLLVSLELNCSLTWFLLHILLKNNLQLLWRNETGDAWGLAEVQLHSQFSSLSCFIIFLLTGNLNDKVCWFVFVPIVNFCGAETEKSKGLLSSLLPDGPRFCFCRGGSAAWQDWWTSVLKAPIPTYSLKSLEPATVRPLAGMWNGSVQLSTTAHRLLNSPSLMQLLGFDGGCRNSLDPCM